MVIIMMDNAAAIIKGNHTNCAQFANSNRLNWLFSRLGSQASGEGTGMLDVLHCVLIDSPEALNMMRVRSFGMHLSLTANSLIINKSSHNLHGKINLNSYGTDQHFMLPMGGNICERKLGESCCVK